MKKVAVTVFLILSLCLSGGCFPDLSYFLALGLGELKVLVNSESVEEAASDPEIDPEMAEKLDWGQQVRDYAEQELGLNTGNSFLNYYDTNDGPAMYNVSATPKDKFAPLTWPMPFVGEMEYINYFQKHLAEEKFEELKEQGYDVYLGQAMAFSTIGWLSDPFFSSMLEQDKGIVAEAVIHELTHNTIYKESDTQFNETVATFVGRQGSLNFIEQKLGKDSETYDEMLNSIHDRSLISKFINELHDELEIFYSRTDLTTEEKIQQRTDIFEAARQRFTDEISPQLNEPERYSYIAEMPVNNAWILMFYRYHKKIEMFEEVYLAKNQNLYQAIQVFEQAENADDPYQFIEEVAGH